MVDPFVAVSMSDDHVATVTLCRPPNNFFSTAMIIELAVALEALDDEPAIVRRMHGLVRRWPRFGFRGYRRIWAMLRREGFRINRKRVYRLWKQEGFKVPQKQRKSNI